MSNYTTDLLKQNDEDLFSNGGCHVFAVCLAEILSYPIRLLRDTSIPLPGGVVHVYCLPATDVMIDFRGRSSERSYRDRKRYDFPPYQAETVSVECIKTLYVDNFGHGGLYADPRFIEAARSRALAAIAADKLKYLPRLKAN